jgi:hypothetical protein
MLADHIDFISAYCDRRCERCPLTHRCSAFTAEAAIAMCGNDRDGLELAFGRAPDDEGVVAPLPRWVMELQNVQRAEGEEAEWRRQEQARRARVDATSIMISARAFADLARPWLMQHSDALSVRDPVVREALEIVGWDYTHVCAKLYRALLGKESHASGEDTGWDDPIQNDWNGSAKVALLSIERSQAAWSMLASWTGEKEPAMLAEWLLDLRAEVERAFPAAWHFRRPGFDD